MAIGGGAPRGGDGTGKRPSDPQQTAAIPYARLGRRTRFGLLNAKHILNMVVAGEKTL